MFIDMLSYGWTRKTAATKGGHLLKYPPPRFCLKEKISIKSIFPSSFRIVYPGISMFKGKLRAKTISGYLTSICLWHAIHGAPFEEDEDQWRILYNGLKRFQPPSKSPKISVTIPDLLALHKHLNIANLEHFAHWAASLVASLGMVRGGSLMLKLQTSFDPKFNIKCSDICFPNKSDSSAPKTAMTVFIPCDKVDGTDGRTHYCIKFHKDPTLNPIKTLKWLFTLTPNVPADAPLFSVPSSNGLGLYHLTSSKFHSRMNGCLERAKHPNLTCHSFRMGGAMWFLKNSKNPAVVKVLGDWEFDAFEVYWGEKERLVRIYLGVGGGKRSPGQLGRQGG